MVWGTAAGHPPLVQDTSSSSTFLLHHTSHTGEGKTIKRHVQALHRTLPQAKTEVTSHLMGYHNQWTIKKPRQISGVVLAAFTQTLLFQLTPTNLTCANWTLKIDQVDPDELPCRMATPWTGWPQGHLRVSSLNYVLPRWICTKHATSTYIWVIILQLFLCVCLWLPCAQTRIMERSGLHPLLS